MSEDTTKRFPDFCYAPHPLGVGNIPNSIYIQDSSLLPNPINPEEEMYFNFFSNFDSVIENISHNTQNKELSYWIDSLKQSNKILSIHNQDFFIANSVKQERHRDFPEYLISINNNIDLELIDNDKLLEELPKPLQEVYKFGRLWINGGFSASGYFYHPCQIKKAIVEEWLKECILDEHYKAFPIEELMVFYTESGCWLMYDKNENVYCGGVECGGFYKSTKKLNEVISIIFSKLTNNEKLIIERFAPKHEV